MKFSRSVYVKAAAAVLALAAAGTASVAEARSNVYFSIGANVAPGVAVGVSNAPVYYPPVYAAPVYVPPPVYVAPVYYGYPYYAPVVSTGIYYAPRHHRHWRHGYRY
jgi:hypothetical protein